MEEEAKRAEEEALRKKKEAKLAKMPKAVDLNGLKPLEMEDVSEDNQTPPKKLMLKPENKNLEDFR